MQTTTIYELVQLLWQEFGNMNINKDSLLHYGHLNGWLEDQDEVFPLSPLDKRTAARIIHQFIKIHLHIPDEKDISSAEILKDLYTCRICTNHVAQVFAKGIMSSEELFDNSNGNIGQYFNMLKELNLNDIKLIINRIKEIIYT